MSTDYLWVEDLCACCERGTVYMVCQSWRVWQAYPYERPFGFPVRAVADWRRVFTERTGQLRDEYGRVYDDPIAWLDSADPAGRYPTRTLTPREQQYLAAEEAEGLAWYDPEGFRFYRVELR